MKALAPFAAIALFAATVALAAPLIPRAPFAPYSAGLPPVLAVLLAATLGAAALWQLQRLGWAATTRPPARKLLALTTMGAAFALPTVALDLARPFPADINAPLPEALLFYPAIGLVAEAIFHLAPLALIASLASRASRALPAALTVAFPVAALAVALIEPAFQVLAGAPDPARNAAMTAILTAFGLTQIHTLRRHGFLAAYTLRMGYYLVWHILWGTARLPLLFAS